MNISEKIINFTKSLSLEGIELPDGVNAMNPYKDGSDLTKKTMETFFRKFYSDSKKRNIILGINPGRFGAGVTGITFTDTKRLRDECGIKFEGKDTHEPSSVFVYEVISSYGGVAKFYSQFYLSALCPLGFVIKNDNGREVNYNFYDSRELQDAVTPFIIQTLKEQISFGIDTKRAIILGSGKNYKYFEKLNKKHCFFKEIVPLEHPRFIMQYRAKRKGEFVSKYLRTLES